jgi:hypothetical protein
MNFENLIIGLFLLEGAAKCALLLKAGLLLGFSSSSSNQKSNQNTSTTSGGGVNNQGDNNTVHMGNETSVKTDTTTNAEALSKNTIGNGNTISYVTNGVGSDLLNTIGNAISKIGTGNGNGSGVAVNNTPPAGVVSTLANTSTLKWLIFGAAALAGFWFYSKINQKKS